MNERKRTTVRMFGDIKKKATLLMRHLSFTNFTAFIEQLVRDEWDRRVAATPSLEEELKSSPSPQPNTQKHTAESPSRANSGIATAKHRNRRKSSEFGKG